MVLVLSDEVKKQLRLSPEGFSITAAGVSDALPTLKHGCKCHRVWANDIQTLTEF